MGSCPTLDGACAWCPRPMTTQLLGTLWVVDPGLWPRLGRWASRHPFQLLGAVGLLWGLLWGLWAAVLQPGVWA